VRLTLAGMLVAGFASGEPRHAPPSWSTNSAWTLPRGRWELGLFGASRVGVTDRVELAVHPLLFFALPHAEAKLRLFEHGDLTFASRHRLSYPTWFLKLVSKEGSGGLLPATTDVPQALQLESDAIGSWRWAPDQLATLGWGLAVAPSESTRDLPLLDFPFLYPRFAALHAWGVPRMWLSFDGRVLGPVYHALDARWYVLPLADVEGAYAFESGVAIEYRFGSSVALRLGTRTSIARYPIGTRFHYLPYVDVRVGF
jgi:hypothetical protein